MDISPLLNDVLQGLGIILLAVASLAGQKLFAWMKVKITAEDAHVLQTIANNALDWAISQARVEIDAKGWNHPDVKSGILRAALTYAQDHAGDALKLVKADAPAVLKPVLERSFAGSVSTAAASPATPAVTTPPTTP